MPWTMQDAGRWVAEHGGIDAEGGPSPGLDALEVALAERRFGAERERVAREFLRITRAKLEALRRLDRELEEDERHIHDLEARRVERRTRATELALSVLGVKAAQSQAETASKALRVSWLALFVAVAALALTAYDLATRAN